MRDRKAKKAARLTFLVHVFIGLLFKPFWAHWLEHTLNRPIEFSLVSSGRPARFLGLLTHPSVVSLLILKYSLCYIIPKS